MTGGFTQGETLIEALEMAEAVLNLVLTRKEDKNGAIPMPGQSIRLNSDERIAIIKADTANIAKQ